MILSILPWQVKYKQLNSRQKSTDKVCGVHTIPTWNTFNMNIWMKYDNSLKLRGLLTSMVSRKLSSSRAVHMLLKLGWWFSTVVRSLSNQASLSSVFAQKSGRSAIFRSTTHFFDNISPGEPGLSFTCLKIIRITIMHNYANDFMNMQM